MPSWFAHTTSGYTIFLPFLYVDSLCISYSIKISEMPQNKYKKTQYCDPLNFVKDSM